MAHRMYAATAAPQEMVSVSPAVAHLLNSLCDSMHVSSVRMLAKAGDVADTAAAFSVLPFVGDVDLGESRTIDVECMVNALGVFGLGRFAWKTESRVDLKRISLFKLVRVASAGKNVDVLILRL